MQSAATCSLEPWQGERVQVADFKVEKELVREHHAALGRATPETVGQALAERTSVDWYWRGMHPFHEQRGAAAVARAFWTPFLNAFAPVQRREDIFLTGLNEIDGFQSVWAVSMGHLMGLFDRSFLGIRPTGRIAMLRYAEFNRVNQGRITETALFCDIPQLMLQAGQYPFPPQTGAYPVQPGPRTHDGLLYDSQDPREGEATLAVINAMLANMDDEHEDHDSLDVLRRDWHEDMIWWGPVGIGATYTVARYLDQHALPFRRALGEGYQYNGHLCRLAEGRFGGFFGWPNLTLRNAGGYMGMTAGPGPSDMRVVDLYRVENGKIAENWVFIDLLNYLNLQGLDVLARLGTVNHVHG